MQKPAPGERGASREILPPGLIIDGGWINLSFFYMLLLLKLVIGISLQAIFSSITASPSSFSPG